MNLISFKYDYQNCLQVMKMLENSEFCIIFVWSKNEISKIYKQYVAWVEKESWMDLKFGTGIGIMGSGDLTAVCFENELNYKLNHYFSSSVSIGFGRSIQYRDNHSEYLQASLNLFISPFGNNKKNNFKIGAGFTLVNTSYTYLSSSYYFYYFPVKNYNYYAESLNGFNLIIENEYKINTKFLIGGKLFMTAGFEQGGIVFGAMFKMGIVL